MIFTLPMPPSVNALYRNITHRGRAKTTVYKTWLIEAGGSLNEQKIGPVKATPVEILIELDDRRRGDASNRIKAVEDLLVTQGILPDDSRDHVRKVTAEWVSVEGCRVTITEAA